MGAVKLYPIRISKEHFERIPKYERVVLVQFGWLCNELMLFHRLLLALKNNDISTQVLRQANSSMILTITRLLSGRLYEGWLTIKDKSRISQSYGSRADSEGAQALQRIKDYFNHSSVLKDVRNKFAFHTDSKEIERSLDSLSPEIDLTFYLSHMQGNTLAWFADGIIANAMQTFGATEESDTEKWFQELYRTNLDIANDFIIFSSQIIQEIMMKHLNITYDQLEGEVVNLEGVKPLSELCFPFFVAEE